MSAPRGWDERDYKLWSAIQLLPSYGRRGPKDILISRAAVENLIAQAALKRAESDCRFCAQGDIPIRSSVSDAMVHMDATGHKLCERLKTE